MSERERALRSVRCERHGLRYDPRAQDGCALCRRERGETPEPVSPSAAGSASPVAGPLVVTAILLLLATAGLTVLHTAVAHRLQASVPGLAPERAAPP